jgi:hypothetical protein
MHFLLHQLNALLLSLCLWLAVNAALYLITLGSPRGIRNLMTIRRLVHSVPPGTLFTSHPKMTTATYYDAANDEERSLDVWRSTKPSLLRWSPSRPLSAVRVGVRVRGELAWKGALLVFFSIPLIIATVVLSLTVSRLWIYAILLLLGHQIFMLRSSAIFFLKRGTFYSAVVLLFFHRTPWGSHFSRHTLITSLAVQTLLAVTVFAIWPRFFQRE